MGGDAKLSAKAMLDSAPASLARVAVLWAEAFLASHLEETDRMKAPQGASPSGSPPDQDERQVGVCSLKHEEKVIQAFLEWLRNEDNLPSSSSRQVGAATQLIRCALCGYSDDEGELPSIGKWKRHCDICGDLMCFTCYEIHYASCKRRHTGVRRVGGPRAPRFLDEPRFFPNLKAASGTILLEDSDSEEEGENPEVEELTRRFRALNHSKPPVMDLEENLPELSPVLETEAEQKAETLRPAPREPSESNLPQSNFSKETPVKAPPLKPGDNPDDFRAVYKGHKSPPAQRGAAQIGSASQRGRSSSAGRDPQAYGFSGSGLKHGREEFQRPQPKPVDLYPKMRKLFKMRLGPAIDLLAKMFFEKPRTIVWVSEGGGGNLPAVSRWTFGSHTIKEGARADMWRVYRDLRNGSFQDYVAMPGGYTWLGLLREMPWVSSRITADWYGSSEQCHSNCLECLIGFAYATAQQGNNLPDTSILEFSEPASEWVFRAMWWCFQNQGFGPHLQIPEGEMADLEAKWNEWEDPDSFLKQACSGKKDAPEGSRDRSNSRLSCNPLFLRLQPRTAESEDAWEARISRLLQESLHPSKAPFDRNTLQILAVALHPDKNSTGWNGACTQLFQLFQKLKEGGDLAKYSAPPPWGRETPDAEPTDGRSPSAPPHYFPSPSHDVKAPSPVHLWPPPPGTTSWGSFPPPPPPGHGTAPAGSAQNPLKYIPAPKAAAKAPPDLGTPRTQFVDPGSENDPWASSSRVGGRVLNEKNSKYIARMVSRELSSLLRHRGRERGIFVSEQGFSEITEIIEKWPKLNQWSPDELMAGAEANQEGRFLVRTDVDEDGGLVHTVAAWSGHSMEGVKGPAWTLEVHQVPEFLIHGTYWKSVNAIWEQGLCAGRDIHLQDPLLCAGKWRDDLEVLVVVAARRAAASGVEIRKTGHDVFLAGKIAPEFLVSTTEWDVPPEWNACTAGKYSRLVNNRPMPSRWYNPSKGQARNESLAWAHQLLNRAKALEDERFFWRAPEADQEEGEDDEPPPEESEEAASEKASDEAPSPGESPRGASPPASSPESEEQEESEASGTRDVFAGALVRNPGGDGDEWDHLTPPLPSPEDIETMAKFAYSFAMQTNPATEGLVGEKGKIHQRKGWNSKNLEVSHTWTRFPLKPDERNPDLRDGVIRFHGFSFVRLNQILTDGRLSPGPRQGAKGHCRARCQTCPKCTSTPMGRCTKGCGQCDRCTEPMCFAADNFDVAASQYAGPVKVKLETAEENWGLCSILEVKAPFDFQSGSGNKAYRVAPAYFPTALWLRRWSYDKAVDPNYKTLCLYEGLSQALTPEGPAIPLPPPDFMIPFMNIKKEGKDLILAKALKKDSVENQISLLHSLGDFLDRQEELESEDLAADIEAALAEPIVVPGVKNPWGLLQSMQAKARDMTGVEELSHRAAKLLPPIPEELEEELESPRAASDLSGRADSDVIVEVEDNVVEILSSDSEEEIEEAPRPPPSTDDPEEPAQRLASVGS